MFNKSKIGQNIVHWIIVLIMAIILNVIFFAVLWAKDVNKNNVVLEVNNPYRITVELEVKCDWSNDLEGFIYHKFIKVPSKSKTILNVPRNMHNCQIWSSVKFF